MLSQQVKCANFPEWEQANIVNAQTEKEKQAIYRFRYQIQVQEMDRDIPYADHLRKRIFDELDPWSYLAYAEVCGRVIGTVRVTVGIADEFPDELKRVFHLSRFQDFDYERKIICFSTKLIVAPDYRKTPVSFKLMAKAYEITRQNDVQFSFGGCNPYLVPMYEQLGYRQFTNGFQDPGYGFVIPIVILPEDIDHLSAVRSPYLRFARKMANLPAARQWFMTNFPETARYPVSLLTGEQERWDYVAEKVGDPLTALPVLGGLNREEAGKLLRIATQFECGGGQQFIRCGDVCNELIMLLSGEMMVTGADGQTFRAVPGAVIGTVGLAEQAHHQIDAVAVSDCEILAVARVPFEKLQRAIPGLLGRLRLENCAKEEN